jgi:hypothetical protein
MPVQDIFVLPWLLYSRPGTKYFFLHHTLFQYFVPIAQPWAGSHAGSRVSQYVSQVKGSISKYDVLKSHSGTGWSHSVHAYMLVVWESETLEERTHYSSIYFLMVA